MKRMCQNTSQSRLPREEQRSVPKPRMNSSRSNDDVKTTVMLKDETTATKITSVETPTTFKTIAHGREGKTVTVVHFDELPHWMQCDPYIKYGYRRPQNSFRACFWSLFYPHNELVNTWSHLLPACFFLLLPLLSDYPIFYKVAHIRWTDVAIIHMYICGTTVCLFLSALFHSLSAHSKDVALRFLKLDYLGIVLTISTTCISATYFGLYGQARLQTLYMVLTVLCAIGVFWAVLDPNADGPNASRWRAAVFIALAISGIAPIVHVALAEGPCGLERFPLVNIIVTCASYVVGTACYIYRWPEKLWPGTFDLWGSSHQIFHVLVAFGQIVHLLGLRNKLLMQNGMNL